jgi:hypothetical protein
MLHRLFQCNCDHMERHEYIVIHLLVQSSFFNSEHSSPSFRMDNSTFFCIQNYKCVHQNSPVISDII